MITQNLNKLKLPFWVFCFVFVMLAIVQVKVSQPMILAERFWHGAGWIEILIVAAYGAFVAYKMQDTKNVPRWRRLTWSLFSIVFFSQLIIGLFGYEKFLMTGKLHLPIPMMIMSGPIYRGHISVMTILFLSTIILSGPAWCSQFCYFGAFDGLASTGKKTAKGPIKHKFAIKSTLLFLIITVTIILRFSGLPVFYSTILAVIFGLVGIAVIVFLSRKYGKMYHCILYCPIGTLVNIFKRANPFRLYIDNSCTLCMKCTSFCKYDALNPIDIKNKKPSFTCTLCGDCLAACKDKSIKYKYLKMNPMNSRMFYLFITISLHAICLALARI